MIKKQTINKRDKISNDLMSYIYDNLDTHINLDYLASEFEISKFHLHRIFKESMGKTIYQCIQTARLQKASNILLTNKNSTISEISLMCGYSSQVSFIRAFKQYFKQTPKYWRNCGYKEYSRAIIDDTLKESCTKDFNSLKRSLIKVKPRFAYYLRQKGYEKSFKDIWEKLEAWRYTNDIEQYEQIGIFHDNPTITALSDCAYVACIVPSNQKIIDTNLPILEVQECLCITFELACTYFELLKTIEWVYHEYLPTSGYEKITIPTYIIYKEDNFKDEEPLIKGTLHIPVKYV